LRAARLNSSAITRIAYDDLEHVLSIWFRDSGCYLYFDVPRDIYDALKAAASAGRFFAEHIKGRFRCQPERKKFRPAND